MRTWKQIGLGLAVGAFALGILSGTPADATDIAKIVVSTDVPIVLSETVGPGQVFAQPPATESVSLVDLGPLPAGAAVDGHHSEASGVQLFTLQGARTLPGGVTAGPADVVEWNGSSYRLVFEAALEELPRGVRIDAVARDHLGRLLLSFDRAVQLGGLVVQDEDVVSYDGGLFSAFFDGSQAGVQSRLDVDGAHYFPSTGGIAVSFDGSGQLQGIDFDDEDVLEYDAGSWSLLFDGDAASVEWRAADVDAVDAIPVPEPAAVLVLAGGVALLGGLHRRRTSRATRKRAAVLGLAFFAMTSGTPSQAADGAIPISQPAALQGNVTAGDAAGFPVRINTPGSYVLTSNLIPPADQTAIEIAVNDVHIDLNGFALVGVGSCTGTGATLSCSGNPNGSGVIHTVGGVFGTARNSTVRDGNVRGFNAGVALGSGSRVTGVIAEQNRVGIDCENGCVIADNLVARNQLLGIRVFLSGNLRDNLVVGNGADGIQVTNDSVVRGNVSAGNGGDGSFASGQGSLRGNLFVGNSGNGARGNDGGLVSQNMALDNGAAGLALGSSAGFIENVVNGNGQTITGGTSMIHNHCDSGSCP